MFPVFSEFFWLMAFDLVNLIDLLNIKWSYFYFKPQSNDLWNQNLKFKRREFTLILINFHSKPVALSNAYLEYPF